MLHICLVKVQTCSDSYISSTCAFINNYLGVIIPVFTYMNSYVPESTMGADEIFNGTSSTLLTCSEFFRFNHIYVHIYLPEIMSYIPLAESS